MCCDMNHTKPPVPETMKFTVGVDVFMKIKMKYPV